MSAAIARTCRPTAPFQALPALRRPRARKPTLEAASSDSASGASGSDASITGQSAADYSPQPQNTKSSYSAIALAAGSWKPYQVFAIGGIARILCMMHSPAFASMFAAPFSEYIGQANAVALSMLPGALLLLKLGDVIQKKKWHETNVGLAVMTIACIALTLVLRAF